MLVDCVNQIFYILTDFITTCLSFTVRKVLKLLAKIVNVSISVSLNLLKSMFACNLFLALGNYYFMSLRDYIFCWGWLIVSQKLKFLFIFFVSHKECKELAPLTLHLKDVKLFLTWHTLALMQTTVPLREFSSCHLIKHSKSLEYWTFPNWNSFPSGLFRMIHILQ